MNFIFALLLSTSIFGDLEIFTCFSLLERIGGNGTMVNRTEVLFLQRAKYIKQLEITMKKDGPHFPFLCHSCSYACSSHWKWMQKVVREQTNAKEASVFKVRTVRSKYEIHTLWIRSQELGMMVFYFWFIIQTFQRCVLSYFLSAFQVILPEYTPEVISHPSD